MDPSNPQSFNHRTEALSTGRSYHFVDQKPENYDAGKTVTLLLVHGFPDLWFGWRYQIAPWVTAGYRVIAPDMLGYGGTDKPVDPAEYTLKKLSDDLAAILDVVGVEKAVIIGHDWGSPIVGRFALWYPEKLLGLIQLSIPFRGPPAADEQPPDFAKLLEKIPNFGYQAYFADPSSTKEIEENINNLFNLFFSAPAPKNPDAPPPKIPSFTLPGQLRRWILPTDEDEVFSRVKAAVLGSKNIISDDDMKYVLSQFSNSMLGPLQYYRTGLLRFKEEQDEKLYERKLSPDLPYLFIRGIQDPTSPPDSKVTIPKLIPQAKVVEVDAGHWLMITAKDTVTNGVLDWLSEVKL